MKNLLNSHLLFVVLAAVLVLFSGNVSTFAQNGATRRLYVATSGGFDFNEAAAKDALAAGADINWQNDAMNGETMLITAIKGYKEAKVIKFLLDNGADASIKDDTGKTALEWARQRNIGRNSNGREIISMFEAATEQKANPIKPDGKTDGDITQMPDKSNPTRPTSTVANKKRTGGAPSDEEIRTAMEKSFTEIYQSHFFGVKNKVTFEWTDEITVGAMQTIRAAPKSCYPVKLTVSVTAEDPRDGNRSTSVRGQGANIGGVLKNETFCFYKDGFDEWNYGTYEK